MNESSSSAMTPDRCVYIAGHNGLVGSALVRRLHADGYSRLVTRAHAGLDLTDTHATAAFFATVKPEYVFLAAAKVGRQLREVGTEERRGDQGARAGLRHCDER